MDRSLSRSPSGSNPCEWVIDLGIRCSFALLSWLDDESEYGETAENLGFRWDGTKRPSADRVRPETKSRCPVGAEKL